jgi:hypothetical protein
MMGRLNHDQGQLFYSFCLEEVVPDAHLVREIWRDELAVSKTGLQHLSERNSLAPSKASG